MAPGRPEIFNMTVQQMVLAFGAVAIGILILAAVTKYLEVRKAANWLKTSGLS